MKLKEAFSNWVTDGIFKRLKDNYGNNLKFFSEIDDASTLDFDYFGNRSGQKETSCAIDSLLETQEQGSLTDEAKNTLAKIIYFKYGRNWNKLYDTMIVEYNPLDTYSVKKSETGSDINKEERDLTAGSTVSNERSYSDNSSNSSVSNADNNVYGFNSNLPSPSDNAVNNDTSSGIDEGTSTHSSESSSTDKGIVTRTRTPNLITETKGNIFTSQQKLIESEREVWKFNFYNTIFENVDEILTSPVYANC